MDSCEREKADLAGLLLGELPSEREGELLAHVEGCAACARELASLRAAWSRLPDPVLGGLGPPRLLREVVLAHARSAVGEPRSPGAEIWARARRFAVPVLLGVGAAALVVVALGVRGLLGVEGTEAAVVLSLILGGLVAVLAGAARETSSPAVRSVLAASAAAFAGYVVLTVALPIPDTVEFCRVRLLAAPELSMGSLCLIYLGIALLYAGLPAGVAAWLWSDPAWRPASVLAQAILFVLLAVPVLVLHLGTAELVLGLSALVGLAAGALGGGAAGRWLRGRGLSGAFA